MINKRKLLFIWLVLLSGVVILSLFFCGCSKKPEKPTTQYGEFPFKLVYEINGERIEIEDTFVIEYLGQDWNEGLGIHNKWRTDHKNATKSNNHSSLTLFDSDGVDGVTIFCLLGSCEYYMGLEETAASIYTLYEINPGDIVISSRKEFRVITDDELYNKFGIKIIEKSVAPPIS